MKSRGKTEGNRKFIETRRCSTSAAVPESKFNGKVGNAILPRPKTPEEILEQLRQIGPRTAEKHQQYGGRKRGRDSNELNWSKKCIFFQVGVLGSTVIQA